jgi:hypothetical protein
MRLKWIIVATLTGTGILQTRASDAAFNQELARARAATAIYHNVDRAIADGYVRATEFESGEGYHYANFALMDGNFEIERPEALLYTVGPDGQLRLAGVEYMIPLALSDEAPEGFTGEEDLWREDSEGFGLWELNVWLWLGNPDGMFAARNPRIP